MNSVGNNGKYVGIIEFEKQGGKIHLVHPRTITLEQSLDAQVYCIYMEKNKIFVRNL